MKKILTIRMFSVICLVLFIGLIDSCKKDEDASSGQVVLLSFGPSGLLPGSQISFIGNNLDQVTAIELVGASVPKASFVSQTSEAIVIVAPLETEEGFITLKSPQGDIVSKTKLSFKVPVTIESVTIEARPGNNVTITGEYMNWVTEVQFSKDLVVKEFVSQSLNELVVTVPEMAQTGSLVLSTGGTKPLTLETDIDLIVTLPSISGLAPNPIAAGDTLAITGANLDLTMGVSFKGVTLPVTTFVSKTPEKIEVVFPETGNKGKITLVAYSGVTVESEDALELAGGLPPLAALAKAIYDDALENGFGDWGYGGATDKSNTENVRDGSVAVKKTFNGSWDAVRFAGSSISTSGATEFAFSVYGGPGMGGQVMNVIINNNWGIKTFSITEGEWVEVRFTMADFGNPASIDDWGLQAQGSTGFVYIDLVGLR